jgi:peptidoglycan hydrolase-like protein with peptidoglycan-binding domain
MPARPTIRQGSKGPDVALLQKMLNTIPQTLMQRLIEDGLFGRKTLERVVEFQRNAKLVADGVVGPQSWAMLDKLTQLFLPPGTTTPGKLGTWSDERYRQAVLTIALAEALPVSKVSDLLQLPVLSTADDPKPTGKTPTATPDAWRFGWPRLKQYYDEVSGVNAGFWSQTGELKVKGKVEVVTNLNGVRGNNWRAPNPADPHRGGMHWCGIFAIWCWRQAGVRAQWRFGFDPTGVKKQGFSQSNPAPKPGDILVQGGSLVHHSLLLPDEAGPNHFLVINGNSDYQSVLIKPIARKSVVAFYGLDALTSG